MYSAAAVSRLVKLDAARVRRWLEGYQYQYTSKRSAVTIHRQGPLVRRRGAAGSRYASFLDLIDLLFVKEFVAHGVSVQKLRRALEEAARLTGDHHFAQRRFWTDGRRIYFEVKNNKSSALLELLSGGQWVIAPVIKQIAHQIEFDSRTGISRRWFPLGRSNPIVVDPSVGFGAPTIVNRGI